jgi:hypothetical protein
VQIHAEVAVEFGESYKLTYPAEKRSVDQLGKTRQPASQPMRGERFPFLPCGFARGSGRPFAPERHAALHTVRHVRKRK